jgi:ferritin-like metal-binding protein YciE/small-conductance mechanosensitive channel
VPDWIEAAIIFTLALALSWTAGFLLYRYTMKALGRVDTFWQELVARTRGPVQMALIIMALGIATNAAALSWRGAAFMQHALMIGLIACIAWVLKTAMDIWIALHLKRYRIDVEDNLLARKHVTQSRILQRVGSILIVAVGVGAALMTIEEVRQYGVSLLASAGAAGIIIGIALQSVLRNLLAGIQIAMTQPIRIDDAVIVEGEWGNIEEITATYVVVRIWDLRRLVLPLTYFIDQPFQNWTRKDSTLIGSVMLYLDHEVSINDLRREAERVVHASDLWNGQVFVLQVTDFTEGQVEVRVLASAPSAGKAFDLRCELREALLAYLQNEQPHALPKTRIDRLPRQADAPQGSADSGTEPDWRWEQTGPEPVLSALTDTPGDVSTSPGIPQTEDSMPAKDKTLNDLFIDTLRDIYYAERKILKALPKMQRAAQSEKLAAAFEHHRDETETHIERLQKVFELVGKAARGKTCDAIEGIIAEGEEIMEDFKGSPALDAGLISAAQAVEHYEITRYGTLRRWATELGMKEAAKLLSETLGEESAADNKLTKLAESSLNAAAQ